MESNKELNISRRNLLKGLTTATVASAVTAATTTTATASETVKAAEKSPAQQGYHETQHILDYYDTL